MKASVGVLILISSVCKQFQVPLTYAFSSDLKSKYPIVLSFEKTQVQVPDPDGFLHLYNLNLTIQTKQSSDDNIVIGLKEPSEFIYCVAQNFKVQPNLIEFGKGEYLKLIINDVNFVESQDIFTNGATYLTRILYNYGAQLKLNEKTYKLINSNKIYFNELLIRQILTQMPQQNDISYQFIPDNKTIQIKGNLQNFPMIFISKQSYQFFFYIDPKQLYYIPTSDPKQVSEIGINALKDFSKFQILNGQIIFKRTSKLYMLYLFLGYFGGFCLIMILLNKQDYAQSLRFVRNFLLYIIKNDRTAMIAVARTQLE